MSLISVLSWPRGDAIHFDTTAIKIKYVATSYLQLRRVSPDSVWVFKICIVTDEIQWSNILNYKFYNYFKLDQQLKQVLWIVCIKLVFIFLLSYTKLFFSSKCLKIIEFKFDCTYFGFSNKFSIIKYSAKQIYKS